MSDEVSVPIEKRLQSRKFIGEEAIAAIHGKKLPLNLGRPLQRLCVVRGIRHHAAFARGEAASLKGLVPMFTRAINARLIMSGEIPQMDTLEEMPYCIWHPDFPPEQSLYKLADQYPNMHYQIGRVCAIAGYTNLYKTLDILPEIAIAEEARESSPEIYQLITHELVKWKVFDDYTGTISKPTPAYLNEDTVLLKELSYYRQGFSKPSGRTDNNENGDSDSDDPEIDDPEFLWANPWGYTPLQNRVTGDEGLDAPASWVEMPTFANRLSYRPNIPRSDYQSTMTLLSSPLPRDLPQCEKNILIVMAAYRGDIDRYHRLRRPHLVGCEVEAVVRGVCK